MSSVSAPSPCPPSENETLSIHDETIVSSSSFSSVATVDASAPEETNNEEKKDGEERTDGDILDKSSPSSSGDTTTATYKHGFVPGDHIVRWEMLPIAYPIQIHGIVLETLDDGGIVIADFGLSSCKEEDATATATPNKEEEKKDEKQNDDTTTTNNNSDTVSKQEAAVAAEEAQRKKAEAVILTAWEKVRPKERKRKRINIITLASEKDLKKWSKVNYGGSLFSLGGGAVGSSSGETEKNIEEGGENFLRKTAKWFDSLHEPQQQQGEETITLLSPPSKNNLEEDSSSLTESLQTPSTTQSSLPSPDVNDKSEQQQHTLPSNEENATSSNPQDESSNDTNNSSDEENYENDHDDESKAAQKSINDTNAIGSSTSIQPQQQSSLQRPPSTPRAVPLNNYGATSAGASANRHKNKRRMLSTSPLMKSLSHSFSSLATTVGESEKAKHLSSSVSSLVTSVGEGGKAMASNLGKSINTAAVVATTAANSAIKTAKSSNIGATTTNEDDAPTTTSPNSTNTPPKKTLPKSDPAKLVLARTKFLLQHGESILPPYHVFDSNSECIAVWCKTGTWSTLQASIFLHTSAIGHAKGSILLGLSVAAVQPWLVPAIAGMGIAAVGMPWMMLWSANGKWKEATRKLTDEFWKQADNDVFVACIEAWSGLE